ncbi:MAG: hypothetical protein Kow0042_08110 [Calditrichia bacterium]
MKSNKEWAEQFIRKIDPAFRDRWEIYEDLLTAHFTPSTRWLDLGAGSNEAVWEFSQRVHLAVGMDILKSNRYPHKNFICADIPHLPLKTGSINFISLRFVVEHLNRIEACFAEMSRVVEKGGKILILTTNLTCPFIFIPKLIPYRWRSRMMKAVFKVSTEDIFPTYHRLNSVLKFRKQIGDFKRVKLEFIQDINYSRMPLFWLFFSWHLLTRGKYLAFLRSNILAVYQKV